MFLNPLDLGRNLAIVGSALLDLIKILRELRAPTTDMPATNPHAEFPDCYIEGNEIQMSGGTGAFDVNI